VSQHFQTLRSRYLGERMRELRDARGYSLKLAGQYLDLAFSTLARYERAEWPFRRHHVEPLLDLYGVYDEATRAQLLTLAQTATRINHWHQDGINPVLENQVWVDPRWVESRATVIASTPPTWCQHCCKPASTPRQQYDRAWPRTPHRTQSTKRSPPSWNANDNYATATRPYACCSARPSYDSHPEANAHCAPSWST
jgi:transcriptional regulator with XRE-family HTH domain